MILPPPLLSTIPTEIATIQEKENQSQGGTPPNANQGQWASQDRLGEANLQEHLNGNRASLQLCHQSNQENSTKCSLSHW